MHWLKAALFLGATVALVATGSSRIAGLPPMGRLLDPFLGFWQNAEASDFHLPDELDVLGLHGRVHVVYDDRRVAHIFAAGDHDLYFAQGYLAASERLFQMDLLSRLPAGRFAEILGPEVLELDRFHRRLGLRAGAEASLARVGQDSVIAGLLEAYSAGVNAYIASLSAASMPLEYKLLGCRPEPWSPLRSLMVQQYMVLDLSGLSLDRLLTHVRDRLGEAAVESAYPRTLVGAVPVVPGARARMPIKPNGALFSPRLLPGPTVPGAGRPHGASNSWALAGSRTRSGSPLLASDPHLSMSLPSIWHEVQLSAPGVDVYGVSIPGLPMVIIGFDRSVAWGVTNSNADVLDWYQLEFREPGSTEYKWDGAWREARISVEEILVRDVGVVRDTLLWTDHGPVVRRSSESSPGGMGWPSLYDQVPPDCAMRWLAHTGGNELRTFYRLNRATDVDDVVEALLHFVRPAQNFVYATTQGDIGMQIAGQLPRKRPEEGRFLRDGSKSAAAIEAWIPAAENPGVINPDDPDYVFSANQHPIDGSNGNYLGFNFAYYRAKRLSDRLAPMRDATPDSMRLLQLDKYNLHAEALLPDLLAALDRGRLRPHDLPIVALLQSWNYENLSDALAPTVFNWWWRQLNRAIWHDELEEGWAVRLQGSSFPTRARVVEMVREGGEERWFDDVRTPQVETFADLARSTFAATSDSLLAAFGPMGPAWAWSVSRQEGVRHMLGIGAFSREDLQLGGGPAILNAVSQVGRSKLFSGPSWRMVVSLKPEGVVGWGVYPGGQSGNPGSHYYDNGIQTYEAGELNELLFLKDHSSERTHIAGTLIMESR